MATATGAAVGAARGAAASGRTGRMDGSRWARAAHGLGLAAALPGGLLLGVAQGHDGWLAAPLATAGMLLLSAGWMLGAPGSRLPRPSLRAARWLALAAGLALWQWQGMGWLSDALPAPERQLGPWVQGLSLALNLTVWLALLALLAQGLRRAWPGQPRGGATDALAWALAWWGWQLVRESSWWGGGYASLALPLLEAPAFAALLPWTGAALAEASLAGACALGLLLGRRLHAASRWPFAGLALLVVPLWPLLPVQPAEPRAARQLTVLALPAPSRPEPGWTLAQRDAALATLHEAIATSAAGSLIVGSEGYLGEPPPSEPVGVWADLLQAVQAGGSHLLLGMPLGYRGPEGSGLMNGVLQLSPQADGRLRSDFYVKQRLAPGGETLPWPQLFEPLLRSLGQGTPPRRVQAAPDELSRGLFAAGEPLGLSLCHELAFGMPLARQSLQASALLNLADDSWLDAPVYRLQVERLARLRAAETGKPLLRISQGSGSLLVGGDGRLLGRWPDAQRLQLPLHDGVSAYARWAPWQQPLVLGLLVVFGLYLGRSLVTAEARP